MVVSGACRFWQVPGSWLPACPGHGSEIMRVAVLGVLGSSEGVGAPALAGGEESRSPG